MWVLMWLALGLCALSEVIVWRRWFRRQRELSAEIAKLREESDRRMEMVTQSIREARP